MTIIQNNYKFKWNINKNVAFKYKKWTVGSYIEAVLGVTIGLIIMISLVNTIISISSSLIKYG